ncbi:MAG: BMP family ABC transporter substrate-binding protein [Betaproteobacteria bacterium]|nr:BMP family ABC transporter substrate-binding protein [Betaproteobacteria bacterium]
MFFRIAQVICCAALLWCAGTAAAAVPAQKTSPGNDQLQVVLLLSGHLGDSSYNDALYEGLVRAARDFGINYALVVADKSADVDKLFEKTASSGADLIIASDPVFQRVLAGYAAKYPQKRFASIDMDVSAPNVLSVVFASGEGGFLAGAAAAIFAGHEAVPGMGKNPALGWVGGERNSLMEEFRNGFVQGAAYVNPQLKVLTGYVGSFDDPAKGRTIAADMYAKGARVIMHVAGRSGLGVFEAADAAKAYAIGVDKNQDAIKPGHILTSLLKRVDIAVWYTIETLTTGTFEGGSILKMNAGNAGMSLTSMSVMRHALGDAFPEELPGRMEEITQDLKTGKIKILPVPEK